MGEAATTFGILPSIKLLRWLEDNMELKEKKEKSKEKNVSTWQT